MFKVNSRTDRLNYGDILMPPTGYTLEAAVGTTYSLDLEALTAISISLGLAEETDSELMHNPICMLNALQKVSDKILIFCEAGQVKFPANQSSLFLLLEKMIVPVALPYDKETGRYPAFHPKIWILMYQNDIGNKTYRFIVLSRNLTFDRSWDVAVKLDGKRGKNEADSSKPIVDFLEFLNTQIKPDFGEMKRKRTLVEKLQSRVAFVTFEADRKEFSEFQVMPMGIGEHQYDIYQDPFWKDTFHEMLIMSPFLSGSVIAHFNDDKKGLTDCRRTLITRRTELGKLQGNKADNFHVYVMKDRVYDGEDEISDETEEKQKEDIHAKIYLRRKYADVDLYLGSMNASYSAMNKNVELMLRLRTKDRYLNTSTFLRDIFDGDEDAKENPFEQVDLNEDFSEEESSELDAMERQIKEVCRASEKAEVSGDNGSYQIQVHFKPGEWKYEMMLSPLRSHQTVPVKEEVIFENLDVIQVSAFYVITITGTENTLKRVIMIPTINLPEGRDSAIVQSVVKDKGTFLEYVDFILDDNHLLSILEQSDNQILGEGGSFSQVYPAVYEKMLKTATKEPEKLDEIDRLISMITDKNIVSDEFREMYQTFRKALSSKKSR